MSEYVIVGGGPTGLTLALYLSNMGKKCTLIDKNSSLGGCHRVTRVDGLFTEHGPRVYSSAYRNFINILDMLGTTWEDMFVPYKFNIGSIQGETLEHFSLSEKTSIAFQYLVLLMTGRYDKKKTVRQFAEQHNFSKDSMDYMDRLCRLTDGGGDDKYTMYQFLQLGNQNFFYNLYQPRKPNDEALFKIWEDKLIENGVNILKSTNVTSFEEKDGVYNVFTDKGVITGSRLVLCIPPNHFSNMTSGMQSWAEKNSYITDIPISFHWNAKLSLPKVWGFPKTDWGLAFIVVSDYMNADNNDGTVISTCSTFQDRKSSFTGKSVNESSQEEFKREMFRQLKISFPDLPMFDRQIIHPSVSRKDDKWIEDDSAFMGLDYISPRLSKNLWYVGTQNGRSYYNFTSMESAVTNALFALNEMEGVNLKIEAPWELIVFLQIVLLSIVGIVILLIIVNAMRVD
jgi:hypothetical protein